MIQRRANAADPSGTHDEASASYPGWRVVAACFVLAIFAWGFGFYGLGVYLAELQKIHGWPNALISGATTTYYLASALLLAFVSDAMARFGPRAVVLFGIACFAASGALLTVITEPWQLYAAYLLLSCGWATTSIAAIVTVLGLWFEARRGMAISLSLNGASCGGILIAPALTAGSAYYGFSAAMLTAIGLMLVILVPVVLLVLSRPPASLSRDRRDAETADSAAALTRAAALSQREFWTVTGPFSLGLLAQVGFLVHQISFLAPQIGQTTAGIAVGVTTAMAVVGRVTLGAFMHRLDARKATAASLATQGAALLVMLATGNAATLMVCCAVFGFSVGNLITFPSIIVQREFAARDFALIIGLSTSINQFAYSCGPVVIGLLRDATGSYDAPILACVVLFGLAAAGIMWRIRPGAA